MREPHSYAFPYFYFFYCSVILVSEEVKELGPAAEGRFVGASLSAFHEITTNVCIVTDVVSFRLRKSNINLQNRRLKMRLPESWKRGAFRIQTNGSDSLCATQHAVPHASPI